MVKTGDRWIDQELRKIDMQQKNISDKYNQEQNPNMDRIEKLMQSLNIMYRPRSGQTWQQYAIELITHVDYADHKNYETHIENNGKKAWHTHSKPACFMCEDVNFRNVLLTVITHMAKQHPNNIF